MKKELLNKIKEFSEYLVDWENKKQYYVDELLPNWTNHKMNGLTSEARQLFLDIYRATNVDEWNSIISIIIKVKERYEQILENAMQKTLEIRKEKLTLLFNKLSNQYNFQGFMHSTSFENFKNIMKEGYIYSRNYLEQHKVEIMDIALNPVIQKTSNFYKDYVRFYWRSKTPTNYTNEGIKPKDALLDNYAAHSPNPVVFIFDYSVAFNEKTCFTDVNAGVSNTRTFGTPDASLNYDAIFHNGPISEEEDKKLIKKAKCAEFLYPEKVNLKYIQKIIFRNQADYDRAILEFGNNEKFCIDASQFCNNWLYIKDYNISYSASNITLEIKYHFGKEYEKSSCNLLDYTHTIKLLDLSQKTLKSYSVNSLIHNNFSSSQIFTEYNDKNAKYVCYYIDGIECIKAKIND